MDKFPQAFRRFERSGVKISKIESFEQLKLAFGSWAGRKWVPTWKQESALSHEAKRVGIPLKGYKTREQQVKKIFWGQRATGVSQRGFSRSYGSFRSWQERGARTSTYEKRIIGYLSKHPNASLAEARGHHKRS